MRLAYLLRTALFCGVVPRRGSGALSDSSSATAGIIAPPPPPPASVCQFELFELRVDQVPTGNGPFDSRSTPLATFSSGGGGTGSGGGTNVTVRSFVYQNFTRAWVGGREQLTAVGETVFLVRFAPPTPGLWRWSVASEQGAVLSRGSLTAAPCPDGSAGGFVRASKSGQHFVLSGSGRGLFPVGENVAMPPRPNGTYGMEHYLTKLLQHHANAFRVWLGPSMIDNTIGFPECPGTFSGPSFCTSPLIIETKPRQYSLENAWRVDWVMRYAQEHRMYAHVVLDSWPQEMRGGEWNFSVFNVANGGPLELPFAMFDSLTSNVTDMWLQRMAYIGARFGAFRSVLGWELINEPDTPYMYASKAMKQQYPELQEFPMKTFLPWIQQLARALMAADQGQHLLTTNFASGKNMEQLTMLPEMTFLASHDYQYQGGTTHALHCGGVHEVQNRLRHAGLASKPVFVSENGMVPATLEAKDDPNGRGMKGSQWHGSC